MKRREQLGQMALIDLLCMMRERSGCFVTPEEDESRCCEYDTCRQCIEYWLNEDIGAAPARIGDNTCVCCGAVIPEGLQVCRICEEKSKEAKRKALEEEAKEAAKDGKENQT